MWQSLEAIGGRLWDPSPYTSTLKGHAGSWLLEPKRLIVIMLFASVASWAGSDVLCVYFPVFESEAPCIIWGEASRLAAISGLGIALYLLVSRPSKKITAASLEKGLQVIASVSLVVVLVVALMPTVGAGLLSLSDMMASEDSPQQGNSASDGNDEAPLENGAGDGDLLAAAATIMGLAVFGSALGTMGSNEYLLKGIAYTLMPIITVQAAFMLGVVDIIHFPVVVWIPMTAILLMSAVLAMVASRLLPGESGRQRNRAGTWLTTGHKTAPLTCI